MNDGEAKQGEDRLPQPQAPARRRVLIIEDETGPRETLRLVLKDRYDVVAVDSVPAGLRAMEEWKPDVVITDIRMPGMNGIEGLSAIRKLDTDTAVVMLTGFGDLTTARAAIQLGANDYMTKPFDVADLLRAVARHIEETDRRRERTATAARLAQVNAELSRRLAETHRLATLGLTSSQMVHDISNPLTIVIGYLDLLHAALLRESEGNLPPDLRTYIESIQTSLRHCTEILQTWRSLGNKAALRLEPVAITSLLTEIVSTASHTAPTADVRLAIAPNAAELAILCDRVHLRRAVQNVVCNACRAVSDRGGRVLLSASRRGEALEIKVADDGCGIPPEDMDRIFNPFFTHWPNIRGTGLGLFIVRQVVEDHDGHVEIESRLGEGTTVTLTIPIRLKAGVGRGIGPIGPIRPIAKSR